jgi:excisionase family DNA binding protein
LSNRPALDSKGLTVPLTESTQRRIASINDAAEYAGVSTKTIRRYIAAGRLTGYRVGPRLIKINLAEVDELLHPIPTVGRSVGVVA